MSQNFWIEEYLRPAFVSDAAWQKVRDHLFLEISDPLEGVPDYLADTVTRLESMMGIDSAKDSFGAAVHGNAAKPQRFQNNSEGFAAFLEAYADILPESLIVLEATGGYETDLLLCLCKQKHHVHRVQPLKAAHYMRSLRVHGKTDALDAAALARYGVERHACLQIFVPAEEALQTLQDLQGRREDIIAMKVAEQQRKSHPRYRRLQNSLQAVLSVLEDEIKAIEARMQDIVTGCQTLIAKKNVLCAFKGVGETTAITLIAAMPELGVLTRGEVAALAGLAPHPKTVAGNNVTAPHAAADGSYARHCLWPLCPQNAIIRN